MWSKRIEKWNKSKDVSDLRSAVKNKNVMIIAGTGSSIQLAKSISTRQEIPREMNWVGLIQAGFDKESLENEYSSTMENENKWNRMKERLKNDTNLDADFLINAADMLQKCGQPFEKWIKEDVFSKKEFNQINNYSLVAALDALDCPIITTNYDDLILNGINNLYNIPRRKPLNCITENLSYGLLCEKQGKAAYVYYLHGRYSEPGDIIFGGSSYKKLQKNNLSFLKKTYIFSYNALVFVGVGGGGTDPHFTVLLKTLAKYEALNNVYWICTEKEENDIRGLINKLNDRDHDQDYWTGKIKLITCQNYSELPLLLLSLRTVEIASHNLYTLIDNYIKLDQHDSLEHFIKNAESNLAVIRGPGGAGKTTILSQVLKGQKYFYFSFNTQGYSGGDRRDCAPEITSKKFFETAIYSMGFDKRAMLTWSNFLRSTDFFSEELLKLFAETVNRSYKLDDTDGQSDIYSYIQKVFLKNPGYSAEIVSFLLAQGDFTLVLDGLEPLQGNQEYINKEYIPKAGILDKELFILLNNFHRGLRRNGCNVARVKSKIILCSRYAPKENFLESANNFDIWGFSDIPTEYNIISKARSEAVKVLRECNIKIKLTDHQGTETELYSPLALNILKTIFVILRGSVTPVDINYLKNELLKNKKTELENPRPYEQVVEHIKLILFVFLKCNQPAFSKYQKIVKGIGLFDSRIFSNMLTGISYCQEIDFDLGNNMGLFDIYGEDENKLYDLHPLIRNAVREYWFEYDKVLYVELQKQIAEAIELEYSARPELKKPNLPAHIRPIFDKARHYILAENYSTALNVFEDDIQGENKIASNKFGMHAEILALLFRFYDGGWGEGINLDKQKWALKVNSASSNSLMSQTDWDSAFALEEKITEHYEEKVSNGEIQLVTEYIDSLIRSIDISLYQGDFDKSLQFGKMVKEILDEYATYLKKLDELKGYYFWQEVVNGKIAYVHSWESLLKDKDIEIGIGAFSKTKNFNNEFFDNLVKGSKPSNKEYIDLPHIIWFERYCSLRLRQVSRRLDENSKIILQSLKSEIDDRIKLLKGRVGYAPLNKANLAFCDLYIWLLNLDAISSDLDPLYKYEESINNEERTLYFDGKIDLQLNVLSSAVIHTRNVHDKLTDGGFKNFLKAESGDVHKRFVERFKVAVQSVNGCYADFAKKFIH